jgi:hypothetical protein
MSRIHPMRQNSLRAPQRTVDYIWPPGTCQMAAGHAHAVTATVGCFCARNHKREIADNGANAEPANIMVDTLSGMSGCCERVANGFNSAVSGSITVRTADLRLPSQIEITTCLT